MKGRTVVIIVLIVLIVLAVIGVIVVMARNQGTNANPTPTVDAGLVGTAGAQSVAATATAACQLFEAQYPATPCP